MNTPTIKCPLCGFEYDPGEHLACDACPLHSDCQLTCCPQCGYNSVDTSRSKLAQFASRWLFRDDRVSQTDTNEHRSAQ